MRNLKMINCEYVMFNGWFCYFSQFSFNKLYPTSLTNIVEIKNTIYQGLSKRQLYKEFVRRKVNNVPGIHFVMKFCLC